MTGRAIFEWVNAMPSSIALRESFNAYPILLTLHLVSMAMFAGLIMLWDMRLVGISLKPVPVSKMASHDFPFFPWSVVGFLVSTVTGLLLFYSQPMRYFDNFYFWIKMGLLALAGLNALAFHLTTMHNVHDWENRFPTPRAARIAGIASLALWAGIIATGRLTAYSGLVPDWWVALYTQ